MGELQGALVDACGQHVETAWLVKAPRGELRLRPQEVTCGLPDFPLLFAVHASRRVALLVVPYGFDFHEYDSFAFARDDIEFSAPERV